MLVSSTYKVLDVKTFKVDKIGERALFRALSFKFTSLCLVKLTLTLSVSSVKYYEQSRPVERSGYADDASGNDCGYQQRLFITAT